MNKMTEPVDEEPAAALAAQNAEETAQQNAVAPHKSYLKLSTVFQPGCFNKSKEYSEFPGGSCHHQSNRSNAYSVNADRATNQRGEILRTNVAKDGAKLEMVKIKFPSYFVCS